MLSRTANELYWMARHIERAENTARLLDVTYRTSLLPYQPQEPGLAWAEPWAVPLISTGAATGFYKSYPQLTAENVIRFMVLDARTLRMRDAIYLKGDLEFDAISPSGRRLYLIQHVNVLDQSRYVVRAYDVPSKTLLPGRVADPTQKGWVMEGYPVSRVISPNGRWVYTLYGNPKGFPFVHALDTMRGVAHCVGLPWRGSYTAVYNLRLTLHHGSLAVHWLSGRPWLRMDAVSWRLSADHGAGFPWWIAAVVAMLAATILAAYGRRTRTLAAGATRRDRGPARLGPWLPLTRLR